MARERTGSITIVTAIKLMMAMGIMERVGDKPGQFANKLEGTLLPSLHLRSNSLFIKDW